MKETLSGAVAIGAGLLVRKLITREVEVALRRKGVDPRVAPVAAGVGVGLFFWALQK